MLGILRPGLSYGHAVGEFGHHLDRSPALRVVVVTAARSSANEE